MKQILIAFAFAFTSLCLIFGAYGVEHDARELPPAMYAGGRIISLQPLITILAALGICTALVATGLLIAISRRYGSAVPHRRVFIGSWACLLPALYHLVNVALRAAG
jgi:hypothetical protein